MYDSDEVRDAVRRDYRKWILETWRFTDAASWEWAALEDARATQAHDLRVALHEYLAELDRQKQESEGALLLMRTALLGVQKAVRKFAEWLARTAREVVSTVAETLREWAEALFAQPAWGRLGAAIRRAKAEPPERPFTWQQRSRRPQVQAAHSVDAVAAGRSPSTWFRTRIRGGRR